MYMQISIRSFLNISRRFLSAAFQIQFVPLGSFARRMWHNYRRSIPTHMGSTCEYSFRKVN